MTVLNLPQDIAPGANLKDIIFHDYSAGAPSLKGKSILQCNAFSMVISGEKTMHFAERIVHIKEDEFHLLSTGNCLASVVLSDKTIFKSILIFFDNKTLTDFLLKYHHLTDNLKYSKNTKDEAYIAFKKDDFILNFIDSLSIALKNKNQFSKEMKLLKFEELMLHLIEKYPEKILAFQSCKQNTSVDFIIKKATESNITTSITIEELAFLCNMSVSTFKRKFLKIYGTSPYKWFMQKKMEIARQLLEQGHEKPSEIYHKIGYENHSSFSQSFKQTFGISPREYQSRQLNVLR